MIETFRAPHSTYLLFSAAYSEVHEDQTTAPCFNIQKEFYVGCATCTCRQRQDARLRKYRQVQRFQPVSCELALHWFHTCRNLEEYIMIPLLRCHSGSIIQKWALPLNFPFVVRLMPTKTVSSTKCFVQSLATKYGVPATRLFRKLRRRMFHTMRLHLYHSSFFRDDHQWHVLFNWLTIRPNLSQWLDLFEVHNIPWVRYLLYTDLPTSLKTLPGPKYVGFSKVPSS